MRRTRTERLKAAVAGAAILASSCLISSEMSATAFVLPSAPGPVHTPSLGRVAPPAESTLLNRLSMAVGSQALRSEREPHIPPPPTPDEETDLLTSAVEYRRLRNLESDLALQSPNLKPPPLLSVRAAAAGYGTDMDAYQAALAEGQKARDALVTRNMGLVHHVVTSILGPPNSPRSGRRLNSLSRDDLVQEGAIGLARAVDKYDPAGTNGARFATYAVYWIRAAVLRCIAERDDMVRVPEYVSASVRKMSVAASRLRIDLDETDILGAVLGPTAGKGKSSEVAWREAERAKLLAEEAGLTDGQLAEAVTVSRRRRAGGYTAFEPWMQSKTEQRGRHHPVAVTPPGETAEDSEEIRRVLSAFLKPKEMEALSWRYGLKSASPIAAPAPAREETSRAEVVPMPPRKFRDYQEEAMEDIFGEGGILAYSSAEQRVASSAPPVKSTSTRSTQRLSTTPKASPAAAALSPLPQGGRWGEAMSFAEVGKNMAVSAEYGRRLCAQALKKLRAAAEEGRLEPDLLGV